jgi:hypothetical protein
MCLFGHTQCQDVHLVLLLLTPLQGLRQAVHGQLQQACLSARLHLQLCKAVSVVVLLSACLHLQLWEAVSMAVLLSAALLHLQL